MRFELWRLDDNGNRFLVGSFPDRDRAERRLSEMTRNTHKQSYWITETEGDENKGIIPNLVCNREGRS